MEINPAGNWSHELWAESLKASLKENTNNEQVGEKLVLVNEQFKLWTIHLPAGQSLPFHKHCKPYFYTALTAGKSRSFYSDGKIAETEYHEGTVHILKI